MGALQQRRQVKTIWTMCRCVVLEPLRARTESNKDLGSCSVSAVSVVVKLMSEAEVGSCYHLLNGTGAGVGDEP